MRRSVLCAVTAVAVALPLLGSVPAYAADKVQPVIAVSAQPTVLDPAHPTATISGTVTADGQPLKNVPVDLSASLATGEVTDATTNDAGEFTATLTPNGATETVNVWTNVHESDDWNAASGEVLSFTINRGKTTLTLKADRTKADYGQAVKLSGTLKTGDTALADAPVTITPSYACTSSTTEIKVRTKQDGSFETTAKPVCDVSYYANAKPAGLYDPADAHTGRIAVRQATRSQVTSGSIDKWGKVFIGGSVRSQFASVDLYGQYAQVQYSPNGTSGWKTVKKVRLDSEYFNTEFWYYRSGYFRIKYDGGSKAMGSVSAARRIWRWNSHFTKFKVTPRKLRFKNKLTVSGTLNRYDKTGKHGYAKQKVYIFFTCNSDKKEIWYNDSGWTRTDSKGRFKKRVRAYCTGKFLAFFYGGGDTFASSSNRIKVKVSGEPRRTAATAVENGLTPFIPPPSLLAALGITPAGPGSIG